MMRQRKMSQIEEKKNTQKTEQNSRKKLNKMKIRNQPDAEFNTLVKRILKELRKDLNSIKRIS